MKISGEFLQVSEPEIWAMFLNHVVKNELGEGTLDTIQLDNCNLERGDYVGLSDDKIYLTRSQVAEMNDKLVVGELCYYLRALGDEIITVRYCDNAKNLADVGGGTLIALTPLSMQAEKQNILRHLIEWLKEAE